MARHTGEQLEPRQHRVAQDAAQRQFADDGLFIQADGGGGLLAVVGCHKRTLLYMFALNDSEFFSYEHIAEIRLFHL